MDINQFKLMALFSKLFGGNPTPRQIGGGTQRAQARLAEKRKRNKEIYGDLPAAPPSRQVLRAEARRAAKAHRSGVKQVAMREGWKGGAAVVRRPILSYPDQRTPGGHMKRLILWLIRPLLRLVVVGRQIAILEETGATLYEGQIVSLVIGPDNYPRVAVMPTGGSIQDVRRYEIRDIRWNSIAKRFETEADHAVERRPGHEPGGNVESRDDHPGNFQANAEASEHDQGPSQEPRPSGQANRGPHRESEGGVGPGHDADTSSEGQEERADDPVANPGLDPSRHQGAMIRLGVNPDIPPGVLIGVSPDQHLHITQVNTYSGGLPDGSIIWGNPHTIAWIRGNVPNHELH